MSQLDIKKNGLNKKVEENTKASLSAISNPGLGKGQFSNTRAYQI
ncbi:6696_t:CDS:2 [Diversispora eburnea]|uniref:6696_t:CDS:1 n=1 Tax=Diversispora eburnea TaxID=1213867 RepID=A0A9N8UWJ2_9GLOM|nr:6696_t:CDS:2 [Diversispora eburnea]